QKLFAMKKGQVSDVIKTDRGFVVAKVEDFREGDLPFEAVARELAEEGLRKERAGSQGRKEGEAARTKIQGGAKLEDLFAKDEKDSDAQKSENEAPKPAKDAKKRAVGAAAAAAASDRPKLQETGLFARRGNTLEDIGVSKDAVSKVF